MALLEINMAAGGPSTAIVGSYNMSFASDLGCYKGALFLLPNPDTMVPDVVSDPNMVNKEGKKPYPPSEALFLSRAYPSRVFWNNALNNLKTFILSKNPAFVGLQEMNITVKGTSTGTDAIDNMLHEINSTGRNYIQICKDIVCNIFGNMTRIGLSIILDIEVCGNATGGEEIIDNPTQPGRPLLYVTTDKNFLLISIHGAQKPANGMNRALFNTDMETMNKKFLEDTINTKFSGHKFAQIFVAADLNDRYDHLRTFSLCGTEVVQTGNAPKACCYNWDSSCPVDSEHLKDLGEGYSTCDIPANKKNKLPSFEPNLEASGDIKNYRYTGDKVFGKNPRSEITIYKEGGFYGEHGASTASDHELVFAEFSLAAAGGRRRSKTRRQSRKVRRQRQSRRRR